MSTFKELSQLISVNDICEPFIGEFDNSKSVESVYEEWSIDLCLEKALDPMEQISLVKQNQKIIGWIGFDMLESSKTLYECMEPINGDILISSDTPLLEAIHTVCCRSDSIYLVLKGNRFIGFLEYSHFHKLPFRMCLFALLIDLEKLMLEITKLDPISFLKNLSEGRLNYAKKIYGYRGFSLNEENKEYDSKLIDCTTFIDKFKMLIKNPVIIQKCPNIKSNFTNIAEKIRNSIAHPEGKESGLLPIKREELLPFIQWAEELQIQLHNHVQS
ncbi:hypothetical protein JXJ21_18235 [candidate division KSB1 bacterium]|nr:hypothetical protein [candidate division KSB1 bacterium]